MGGDAAIRGLTVNVTSTSRSSVGSQSTVQNEQ